MVSNLKDLGRQIEVERAIDPGFSMEDGDTAPTLTSNSREYITIYSTADGEPHEVLSIDARRILMKRFPDGRYAFWHPNMGGAPPTRVRGSVQCYLSPDFDETDGPAGFDRKWIDSIGLAGRVCNMNAPDKGIPKFLSSYNRDEHARTKHRLEYQTIKEAQQARRQAQYDADARQQREAMIRLAEAAAGPVSKKRNTEE